jgi:hypothetical protein
MDALLESLQPALIALDPLLKQYYSFCQRCEDWVFTNLTVGWEPTSGFDASGRKVFDPAIDVANIPTRTFPFSSLASVFGAMAGFFFMCLIGVVLLKCCQCRKGPFIPQSVLYPLKFAYNFVQMFVCSYMTLEALILAHRGGYVWFPWTECNVYNFSEPRIANLIWWYFMTKMLDWVDTLFIILGNKSKQFTFLHVYHHASVWYMNWLNLVINYDAEIFVAIGFNAGIHVIMYTYYLISMHMPKDKDPRTGKPYSVWWKKHLTTLQMTQFFGMNLHGFLILYNGCSQVTPRGTAMYLAYIMSLFILFMNFFIRSYCKRSPNKTTSKRKKRQ